MGVEVDGEPLKLRKVLREKWEKPRGSSIERYAGDTRDYYIDDVPLAENEYKRRIAELIDEQQFRLLTDVWAVTKGMHWKDRRTLLAEICGLPEDKQLLAAAPQFAELNEKVGRRTVDEYKSVLMKQRKDMNANLNTLPVRVDECSRMVTDMSSAICRRCRSASRNWMMSMHCHMSEPIIQCMRVQAEYRLYRKSSSAW